MRPLPARPLALRIARGVEAVALALLLGACCFWPFPYSDDGHGHGGRGHSEGGERHGGDDGHEGHGGHGDHDGH